MKETHHNNNRHPREGGGLACAEGAFINSRRSHAPQTRRGQTPAFAGVAALFATLLFFSPARADALPPDTCKFLAAHQPAPDVAYKPGADVHGRPVVEADITPPVVTMPETFSFDITVDLAAHLGLQTPGLEGHAKAGTVTYDKGRLSFNGKPLEGEAEAQLRALCSNDH